MKTETTNPINTIDEIRLGNVMSYESEHGVTPIVINERGIEWLKEDPKSFNLVHTPISIGEEYWCRGELTSFTLKYQFPINSKGCIEIRYLHQLQNLIYDVKGVMIEVDITFGA